MALRDQLRANAQVHIQPGESIQAVFCAQTVSQYFALFSWLIILIKDCYRVVVVTNQRAIVCKSGRMRMTPVNEIVWEGPRSTLIGPAHGLWYKTEVLGEKLYINKRFHKDIAEADSLAAAASSGSSVAGAQPSQATPDVA